MKYLLSIVLAIVVAVNAFSTAQFTEKINDNGVDKGLTNCLLELDSISYSKLKERIPDGTSSTALWRNYIACWKIKNDSLFLDSILIRDITCDTLRLVPAKIYDIYSARRTPSGYFAAWVTDTLRVVSGDVIQYVHSGWMSDWENEEFIAVEDGLLKNRTIYKNRVVNPVDEDKDRIRNTIDSLNLGYIPKNIVLQLGYSGFDENGNPTGHRVEVIRSCGDTIVDNRAVRAFSDATVMRGLLPVYYVRGRYKSHERILLIPKSREPHHVSE